MRNACCNGALPPLSSDPGCYFTAVDLGVSLLTGDVVTATFTNWQDTQTQTVQVAVGGTTP